MAFDQPPIPTPDPRIIVPHPGLSIGYDPRKSGRTHDLDPIPTTGTEWYNALKKHGPILAKIHILWGPAAHYILINGIDTDYPLGTLNGTLYYTDPLTGIIQRDITVPEFRDKIFGALYV
jgi:hypothetical protein